MCLDNQIVGGKGGKCHGWKGAPKHTLSQISHVGTSDLLAPPEPAFVLADAAFNVVVFESAFPSTLTMVNLLFGFGVGAPVLAAAALRTVVLACAVLVVVKVVAFDSVGSLKICGLLIGFDSIFSGDAVGSTLILWNVIADVSGNGSVILEGVTFCNVVKCTLPSTAFS